MRSGGQRARGQESGRGPRLAAAWLARLLACVGMLLLAPAGSVGCGGVEGPRTVAPRARRAPRRAPSDPARALLRHLPAGAHRCAVARPGLVSERRRALLLRIGWSEPLAWTRGLGILAYAMGEKNRADGSQARRSLLYFSHHPSRERLTERLPLSLRWVRGSVDEEPCESEACRRLPRARFLDERTLEITRGTTPGAPSPWAAGGAPRGVETSCARLITASPSMVEAAARGQDRLGFSGVLRVERGVTIDREAATLRTHYRMSGERTADRLEQELHAQAALGLSSPLGLSERSEIVRRGRAILHRMRRTWEELELTLADERLEREALARQAPGRAPLPIERLDPLAPETFEAQIRLRVRRLAGAPEGSEARREEARTLASLLALGVRSEAARESWRERLYGLYMRELDRPEEAAALASRARTEGDAAWALRHRAALARLSAERLEEALRADGITSPDRAPALARTAAARTGEGLSYEDVEAAWLSTVALREALREAPGEAASPPPLSEAELEGEPPLLPAEALAALGWHAAGLQDGPQALYLLAYGRPRPGVPSTTGAMWIEAPGPAGGQGEALLVGRASATLASAAALGESMAAALADGPVRVEGAVIGLDGELRGRFTLAATLRAGGLRLRSLGPREIPLRALRRLLVEPLALRAATDTPWALRAQSEAEASLLREAATEAGLRCRRARLWLRCEAPTEEARLRLTRALIRAELAPPEGETPRR